MQNPAKLRQYADECRRLARTAKLEDKDVLLQIAKAWDECAADAERRQVVGKG
jgi:hypothetical protein